MGESISIAYKKAARMQTAVCGLLFFIFSFVYLYVFQNDVLEALHYSLAHGKTYFAPLASALILTLVLGLLRCGVNALFKLRGELSALSYFPSCLLLGILTDITRAVYATGSHTMWYWLLPLVLLIYTGLILGLRRLVQDGAYPEDEGLSAMNWNLVILLGLCFMTVGIGNTNRELHHELAVERCLRSRRYEKALNVGKNSLEATHTLTALRGYTLACTGMMGEKLFQYPQYYGSEGLFFSNDSLKELRYTNDSIGVLLGVPVDMRRDKKAFLREICTRETGSHLAADYYLCALLLDKDLNVFMENLPALQEDSISLPRYYGEAVLLYRHLHPDYQWPITDSLMIHRFTDYQNRKKELFLRPEEKSWMRRDFGDTYWWYFDYQK